MWEDLLESTSAPGAGPTDGRHFLIVTSAADRDRELILDTSFTLLIKTTFTNLLPLPLIREITNPSLSSPRYVSAPVPVHARSVDSVIR